MERGGRGAGARGAGSDRGAAPTQESPARGPERRRERGQARSVGRPGGLEPAPAAGGGPGSPGGAGSSGETAKGGRDPASRARSHHHAGRDPVPGQRGDVARSARGVPARAAACDSGRARRPGSSRRGGGRVPAQGRGRESPQRVPRGGAAAAAAAGAHASRRSRGAGGAQLPGLDRGAALEQVVAGSPRPGKRPGHSGCGSRAPGEREGADFGVPRCAQAAPGLAGSHPVLRGAAGCRQDLAGPLDRARHGTRVRAAVAGWPARRGRDSRAPPHLRGSASGSHHSGAQAGRNRQPGLHAGRGRQDRCRLPGRSLGGAARGARPRAEWIRFRRRCETAWS